MPHSVHRMKRSQLTLLPRRDDPDGIPRLALRMWNKQRDAYEWVWVPISDEELQKQLSGPVRLAHAPKYWLFRGRFVRQEGVESEPDTFVDLVMEASIYDDPRDPTAPDQAAQNASYRSEARKPMWQSKKVRELLDLLTQEGEPVRWTDLRLEEIIRNKTLHDRLPLRHSELARHTPEELVLRVKHLVLSAERDLQRMRREVEALENFENLTKTPRERIPDHIRLFVWQRDKGCCARCGGRDRLEMDHIVPLAEGGSNTARNIELLCEKCNRAKGGNL